MSQIKIHIQTHMLMLEKNGPKFQTENTLCSDQVQENTWCVKVAGPKNKVYKALNQSVVISMNSPINVLIPISGFLSLCNYRSKQTSPCTICPLRLFCQHKSCSLQFNGPFVISKYQLCNDNRLCL